MGALDQYYKITQAAGVAIVIPRDGDAIADVCQIAINGKQLTFEKKLQDVAPDKLEKAIDKSTPLAINISGKGILYKLVERIEEITEANFPMILPNAAIGDFYVQYFNSGEYSFVAVIRKTEAAKWLELIEKQGFRVLMLSLGPFPVEHISTQLNIYDEQIVFNGIKIERTEDNNWSNVRFDEAFKSPYPLKIENEPLDQSLIVPYAVAFQLLLAEKLSPVTAPVPELQATFSRLAGEKKFKANAFLMLVIFFILLLANFAWLSGLNKENNELSSNLSSSAQTTADLQKMSNEASDKELLIKKLGWDGGVSKSMLFDQTAALMPHTIMLQEVSINPIDKKSDHGSGALAFLDRTVRIRGESAEIVPVNEWVARLKSRKWVKNANLTDYNYSNELNTGIFTITLTY